MGDNDSTVPICANGVREIARMFEAFALAQSTQHQDTTRYHHVNSKGEMKTPTESCEHFDDSSTLQHEDVLNDLEGHSDESHVDPYDNNPSQSFVDMRDSHVNVSRIGVLEADDVRLLECKVPYIIDELLTKEQNYVQQLSSGIRIFMSAFDEPSKNLPARLLGQKKHLFGNIERIRDFHANIFLPSLQQHDPTDVSGICETFCRHCSGHSFYMYVLYAINSKRRERIASRSSAFFDERRKAHGDRLGLSSILVKPLQRLVHYQTMLGELIKALAKRLNGPGVKDQIASCCRAEYHLKRLLEQVDSSYMINDIVNNRVINIMHQGMFRFLQEFEVNDCAFRRRYLGTLFLFDKGVLLTERLDAETLKYRGFISHNRLATEQLDNGFALVDEGRNVRLVELMATDRKVTDTWIGTLKDMEQTRERIFDRRSTLLWRDSGIDDADAMSSGTLQQFVVVRNSRDSRNRRTLSIGSFACSSVVSGDLSPIDTISEDLDTKNTSSWYATVHTHTVPKIKKLQHLFNAEKHFIQMVSNYKRQYLDVLPSNYVDSTRKYRLSVQILLDFHSYILYPKLLNSKHNIVSACDTFRMALAHQSYLESHQMYAATCTQAYATLKSICSCSEMEHYTNLPLEHLARTNAFLFHLMCVLKYADDTFVSAEFKAVASLHVELHRFVERVRDNLKLNSMLNYSNFHEDYGFVEYSDPVSVYGYKMRLLVLTKGLICVRTQCSTSKTQSDTFVAVEFQMPRSAVRFLECHRSKARLKIYANCTKDVIFNVDFPNVGLKEAMQNRLNTF